MIKPLFTINKYNLLRKVTIVLLTLLIFSCRFESNDKNKLPTFIEEISSIELSAGETVNIHAKVHDPEEFKSKIEWTQISGPELNINVERVRHYRSKLLL
jgi:hypothetical protein